MSAPGLNLYAAAPLDQRFTEVAEIAGEERGLVLGAWLAVLCHAEGAQPDARGTIAGLAHDVVAAFLGIGEARAARILEAMQGRLLLGELVLAVGELWEPAP